MLVLLIIKLSYKYRLARHYTLKRDILPMLATPLYV